MGGTVQIDGHSYLEFLIPGLVAMNSMIQSFGIATDINVARFYWYIFEEFQAAPISNLSYVGGEVLAGMTRALMGILVILLLGLPFGIILHYGPLFWLAVILNSFVFASLAVALAIWLGVFHHGRGKAPYWELALGLVLMVLIVNLMGLRNYVAAGHWVVIPPLAWNQAVDVHLPTPWYWLSHPGEVAWALFKRTLYAAGFMPVLVKEFSHRPHWWLLWLACLIVVVKRLRQKRTFGLEEKALMLYIVTVLVPIILVGYLTGYGFRFWCP